MADFVCQNRGCGVFMLAASEQSPGDKDKPARGGKSIDLIRVQDEEMVTAKGLR